MKIYEKVLFCMKQKIQGAADSDPGKHFANSYVAIGLFLLRFLNLYKIYVLRQTYNYPIISLNN